jgi:hypothetical protein
MVQIFILYSSMTEHITNYLEPRTANNYRIYQIKKPCKQFVYKAFNINKLTLERHF